VTVSRILSRRDVAFLLYEWLDVESLTARPRFAEHSRETFDGVLEVSQQIAEREFAPHNAKNDAHEPTFDGETVHVIDEVKAALDAFHGAGLLPAAMDESVGGLQLPHVVQRSRSRAPPASWSGRRGAASRTCST
jgi:alkylation response protein AidB-like acyl-CoA dehydrogenase